MIGSFSWNAVQDAYWLTSALWYSSLVLSILAFIQSAQEVAVLQLLGQPPTLADSTSKNRSDIQHYLPLMLSRVPQQGLNAECLDDRDRIGKWRPRWKMVFTWQCPMMFLAYSTLFFFAGLTIFVCTPLIRGYSWNTGANVAMFYLATLAIAGGTFIFTSFWIYHYVDLEHEFGDMNELETIPAQSAQGGLRGL